MVGSPDCGRVRFNPVASWWGSASPGLLRAAPHRARAAHNRVRATNDRARAARKPSHAAQDRAGVASWL